MKYEKAEANVVLFANDDVIRTSGETNGCFEWVSAIGAAIGEGVEAYGSWHDGCETFSHQCGNFDDWI